MLLHDVNMHKEWGGDRSGEEGLEGGCGDLAWSNDLEVCWPERADRKQGGWKEGDETCFCK